MKIQNGKRQSVYLAGESIEAIYKFCEHAGLPRNISAGVRHLAKLSPILSAILRVEE